MYPGGVLTSNPDDIRTKLLGRATLVPDSPMTQPAIRPNSIYT